MHKSKIRSNRIIFFAVLFQAAILFSGQIHAVQNPVQFTKDVTDRVLSAVRKNHKRIQNNDAELMRVVNHLILPHVDFYEMSRWVAGRNAWKRASAKERKNFEEAFKILVVRTYAQALKDFYNDSIVFQSLRSGYKAKKRIVVASTVTQKGRAPVRVLFRLVQKGGTWKVYDLVVEGVSLLKGYQAQFSSKIRQNGLKSVTDEIRSHNRGT